MKLKVIGCGGMWNKEFSACYLIDDCILIDIPNGCCKQLLLQNNNIFKINDVLITHFHADHYFDMPFYLLEKSKNESSDVNIYCSKNGKNKIEKLFKLGFPSASKEVPKKLNIKYEFGNNFKINDYEVFKVKVDHGNLKPAYGYVFKKDSLTVGFTGDTAYCTNVDYMASICDYLICDCSFILGNNAHMGIDNIKFLAEKYPKCKFITSHMFENTIKEMEKIKLKNIIVPCDGKIIIKEK